MLVRKDSIPQVNVYSSKILFEQVDNRNKKRMAQMLKRKTALSAKHNDNKEKEKNISPMKSPIILKTNKEDDLLIINLETKKNINNNFDNSYFDKELLTDIKLESDNTNKIKKHLICESNIVDNSPVISNNTFFNENNNYYNNSSTNNSNNNSIINRDSQEKEVNISNLENDSIDDIIINKDNLDDDCLLNNDNEKILSKSLYNYDHDDDNIQSKEERKIKEENEFALKYLTSSSDSFVQLDNNLVAKAKAQGGEMTDSYFQALFPDLIIDNNKSLKTKNYEVTEIIKEEKEVDSPFGKTYYISKRTSKTKRISLKKKIALKDDTFNGNTKKKKKSLIKTKSNALFTNKISKINIDKSKKNKTLKGKKFKSVSNFKNIYKSVNNKKDKKVKPEKEKLNMSSSSTNLNTKKIRKNKIDLKLSNDHEFYSTFSSNLYRRQKSEYKFDKNDINKTKTIDKENEINDAYLINNCVKNITKTKNLKISKHYLKNINFYNNCNETNNKNRIIKKRNQNYNNINNLNLNSTILTSKSKLTPLNTTDISRIHKYTLFKYDSKKNMNNININTIKKTNNNSINKSLLHKNCVSSFSLNESINHKKHLTIKDRGKSFSKLTIKKQEINNMLNTEPNFRRNKSNHKKLNTTSNYETIYTEPSTIKKRARNSNNNMSNNIVTDKKKFVQYHKKIDYSYVKAKVETGLSEDILKKLLNNNKKLVNKETNKKIETEKKQSLFRKCKIGINKTIANFKTMASNIKRKLFKKEKNENLAINDNRNINTSRNSKRKKENSLYNIKK